MHLLPAILLLLLRVLVLVPVILEGVAIICGTAAPQLDLPIRRGIAIVAALLGLVATCVVVGRGFPLFL